MNSTKRKAENPSRTTNKLCTMKSGHSRADSDRDSGFSDASSEHMSLMEATDSQDSLRSVVQPGSQLAVVGGSYSGLSPMIIMNNVLLKQPGDNPPSLKPWGFRPAVEVVQPILQQPQVVFLQPVVSRRASSASKEGSSRHRQPKKYLPILKSYPKIAPHPGDSSGSSGRGTASPSPSSTSSSSYSSSSGSERGSSLSSSHRGRHHRVKTKRDLPGGSSNPRTTTASLPTPPSSMSPLLRRRLTSTESSPSSSPARERSEVSPSPSLTPSDHTHRPKNQTHSVPQPQVAVQESSSQDGFNDTDGDSDAKRKRFCNTYNILSKSGLLDITLRTKELLRQNRHTQTELDRLRGQTDLFLQALQSGDGSLWAKLQSSLQEEEEDGEKERSAQSIS